jgi:hypothetical protein
MFNKTTCKYYYNLIFILDVSIAIQTLTVLIWGIKLVECALIMLSVKEDHLCLLSQGIGNHRLIQALSMIACWRMHACNTFYFTVLI